jgi:hydroxymethylglutaryl-CoA reductase (NADPH)
VDITSTPISTALLQLATDAYIPSSAKELVVRVSAPIHVLVTLPTTQQQKVGGGLVDSFVAGWARFMTGWTHLVGDPVMSKWIVIVLAISLALNGYLLKGIAVGLSGSGKAAAQGVRFRSVGAVDRAFFEKPKEEKEVVEEPPSREAIVVDEPQVRQPLVEENQQQSKPEHPQPIAPVPVRAAVPSFMLDTIDSKLAEAKKQADKAAAERSPVQSQMELQAAASPFPPSRAPSEAGDVNMEGVRSLEECIEILESGPSSTELLSDEEVILLAKNGKIAAYALEKVLGNLERAVKVRRALICECISGINLVDPFVNWFSPS